MGCIGCTRRGLKNVKSGFSALRYARLTPSKPRGSIRGSARAWKKRAISGMATRKARRGSRCSDQTVVDGATEDELLGENTQQRKRSSCPKLQRRACEPPGGERGH